MELPLPSRVKPWILSANEAEMVTVRVPPEALGRPGFLFAFVLPFGRPGFLFVLPGFLFVLPFGRPGFLFVLPFGRTGFSLVGCAIIIPFK